MIALIITTLATTAVLLPLVISVSVVYRVSGVVNFGAGYFCIISAAACAKWSGDHAPLRGVLLTLLAGCTLGAVAYMIAIVPARRRGVSAIGLTISTLGFGLLVGWISNHALTASPSILQPWVGGSVTIFGYETSQQRILVIVLAVALLILLYVLFDRTQVGRILTAVSADPELASMYGVRTFRFELLAWIVSGLCLAIGGIFQATLASVSIDIAPTLLVLSLVGAVVGGLGSLPGAVGGALVVALADTASAQHIDPQYTATAAFVVLFVVLTVRPRGLFSAGASGERV